MLGSSISSAFPAAFKRLGEDADLLTAVARIFVEDAPDLLSQVRQGVRDENLDQVAQVSHKLKGMAANVDDELAFLAVQPVIDAARAHALDQVRRMIVEMELQLESLRKTIDQFL